MSTNIELALLTRVVDTGDFNALQKQKIDESYFFSPEAIEVFRFINQTYHSVATAGQTPSRELVQYRFPSFPFFNSTDGVDVLAEELRRGKISVECELFAQDVMNKSRANPMEALATIASEAPRIAALSTRSEDMSLSQSIRQMRLNYQMVKEGRGVIGIPYPWQPINESTQGMRPQNFVVLFGRPKSMKTWIALYIAVYQYIHCRRRVLFYSKEMSPEEVLERVACLITRVDYMEFINGRLQPDVEAMVWTIMEELADDERAMATTGRSPYFIIVSDRNSEDSGGVSWYGSKIREYDPDIAYIDGLYLMKDDRTKSTTIDWKNITHISQDTKRAARRLEIPIVGITQANRGSEKSESDDLTELAFADALGQDADAVFKTKKVLKVDPQTKRAMTEVTLTAPGLRKGIFHGMTLHVSPGHTFEIRKVFSAADRVEGHEMQEAAPQQSGDKPPPRLQGRSPFLKSGVMRDPKIPQR